MHQLTAFVLSLIDHAGYIGLFVVMVIGNFGIPVGTELVVPAAGALVATGHLSNVWLAGGVATLGELVGGFGLYTVGYYGGRPFVLRYGKLFKLSEAKLDRWHAFYEKHGNVLVFVCRFIPFVRGVAALPAGVSRMSKRVFLAYTASGSAIFCFGLALLGRSFGRHFDRLAPELHRISLVVLLLTLIAGGIAVVFATRKKPQSPV